MVPRNAATGPSEQTAAPASRADVTIVMAGIGPAAPVQLPFTSGTSPIPLYPTGERGDAEPAEPVPAVFPSLPTQAANLFQSVVAFIGDGCAVVDDAEYRRRLETCRTCDRRAGRRCTACGCWITVKARGRAFTCPLARWQERASR